MSEGDNALAKINEKAWELLEWFESPAGDKFFTNLANGVNFVVDIILELLDLIGDAIKWFNDLDNSSEILQSGIIALGSVLVGVGIAAAIAWAAANWQLLLAIAVIGLIIYACLELGFSIGEVVSGIAVGVAWVVMFIWDIILALIVFIFDLVVGVGTVVIWVVQGIVQAILWLVTTIWRLLRMLDEIFRDIWYGFNVVVGGVCVGIAQIFQALATTVLGILYGIAAAIDWVFGSNLADTVGGWIKGLDSAVDDLEANFNANVTGGAKDIGEGWKTWASDTGDMYAGKGKYDDFNITDNMKDVYNGAYDLIDGFNTAVFSAGFEGEDFNAVGDWGKNFGKSIDSKIGDFSMKLEELQDKYDQGLTLDGGSLDSVGSIGSDVDISDEDLQLLKDVAARDYLLTLQTSAPQVNNTFGDIKETADVNKILEVIQDMVDEQLAVSLVVE